MWDGHLPLAVLDPPRRPAASRSGHRSVPSARSPRGPEPTGGRRPLPEPPALREDPLTSPRACVNCAAPVASPTTTPRCWGCGRALCTDCYWRHGYVPSVHRCTACLVATPEDVPSISGGRATAEREGFTPPAFPTNLQ
jgi:hypothetical protein